MDFGVDDEILKTSYIQALESLVLFEVIGDLCADLRQFLKGIVILEIHTVYEDQRKTWFPERDGLSHDDFSVDISIY